MKNSKSNWRSVTAVIGPGVKLALVLSMLLIALASRLPITKASTTHTSIRPVSDFVSAQGTFCIDDGMGGCFHFNPPVPNFFGWSSPAQNLTISVDYAGLADAVVGGAFGTTTEGTITERSLPDGRAEVTVVLHTSNALTWATPFDPNDTTLLFGARVTDVRAGANPALGESLLQVTFINTAPGDPLPDLVQLIFAPLPGQEFPSFISFRARADGELRAAFGVPDGTPGRAQVTQNGLFGAAIRNGFRGALADAFPAEHINLRVVGR